MKYICKTCNKLYASPSSLSNHKKKTHVKEEPAAVVVPVVVSPSPVVVSVVENNNNAESNIIQCKYCNKAYADRVCRWRHEKICNKKDISGADINVLCNTVKELKKEIEELKNITNQQQIQLYNKKNTNPSTDNSLTNCSTSHGTFTNSTNCNVNSINITYKMNKSLENDITDDDAMQLLNGEISNMVFSFVTKIYTEDRFKEYRTLLINDFNSSMAEIYSFKNKKFMKEEVEQCLMKRYNMYVSFIERLAIKHVDSIGEDREGDICDYNLNATSTESKQKKELMKLKKVIVRHNDNAEETRRQYKAQQLEEIDE
jgi:hypothetical protein